MAHNMTFSVVQSTLKDSYGSTTDCLDGIKNVPLKPIENPMRHCQLSYLVTPTSGDFFLSSGKRFNDLDCFVILGAPPENSQKYKMGIGIISLMNQDALWILSRLPLEQYSDLLSSARAGLIPSTIDIDIRGVEYRNGGEPFWDIKATEHLYVSSISFRFTIEAKP